MHAHRVDVLDEAHRDHLVLRVANNLNLELLPVEDRLLDEALVRERGVESASADRLQLLVVVAEAAARSAHSVRGTDDNRIANRIVDEVERRLDGVDDARLRRLDAELLHRLLEDLAVLSALDGAEVDADDLHAVLVEDALLRELHGKVEAGLAAEVGEDRVGALLLDDLLEPRLVERLDVGGVGHDRVGHDRRGVGVDEDHLVPACPQCLARLRSGVVEFAGLPDDNRARSDDENLVYVGALHLSAQPFIWNVEIGCVLYHISPLVAGCWLLVVGCWLLVVGYWLLNTSASHYAWARTEAMSAAPTSAITSRSTPSAAPAARPIAGSEQRNSSSSG